VGGMFIAENCVFRFLGSYHTSYAFDWTDGDAMSVRFCYTFQKIILVLHTTPIYVLSLLRVKKDDNNY
jgi:hypothetical protein